MIAGSMLYKINEGNIDEKKIKTILDRKLKNG